MEEKTPAPLFQGMSDGRTGMSWKRRHQHLSFRACQWSYRAGLIGQPDVFHTWIARLLWENSCGGHPRAKRQGAREAQADTRHRQVPRYASVGFFIFTAFAKESTLVCLLSLTDQMSGYELTYLIGKMESRSQPDRFAPAGAAGDPSSDLLPQVPFSTVPSPLSPPPSPSTSHPPLPTCIIRVFKFRPRGVIRNHQVNLSIEGTGTIIIHVQHKCQSIDLRCDCISHASAKTRC